MIAVVLCSEADSFVCLLLPAAGLPPPPTHTHVRLGHNTAHFNVGNYRRSQKEANEVQDAEFFDSHNLVRGGGGGVGCGS